MKREKIIWILIPNGYKVEEILDFGGEEYEGIQPETEEEVRMGYERSVEKGKTK